VVSRSPRLDTTGKTPEVTPRGVLHFFEARLLSEPQVAAMAARDPDLDRLAEAERLIDAMELVAHEPGLHGETDLSVHRALAHACRNPFVAEPVLRLLDVLVTPALRATRHHAWADPDLPPLWHGQHRETVEAIRRREPQAAAQSTWRHLESAARNALVVAAAEPSVDNQTERDFLAFLDAGPYAFGLPPSGLQAGADEGRSHVHSVTT